METPLAFPVHSGTVGATPASLTGRGIVLRAATAADIPYLVRLYAQSREQELAALPPAIRHAFLESQFALQHRHYTGHYRDADFLLLERVGAPIGRYYVSRAAIDFIVIDICLEHSVRGQGIGEALIAQTQRLAAERGCGVRLHVQHDNVGARRLYARLGFSPVGEGDDGAYLPMRWTASS